MIQENEHELQISSVVISTDTINNVRNQGKSTCGNIANDVIVATDEPSQGLVSDFFQWLLSWFASNDADSGNSGNRR
ncbi:unnamed protein product [Schistosoma intercalatum]|nr:unnamed protein product [Schistosoma intercalatum]